MIMMRGNMKLCQDIVDEYSRRTFTDERGAAYSSSSATAGSKQDEMSDDD